MTTRLWSLTLGNFAIGTGAMVVAGMLNELTSDLATTPAAIGVIISAFAMTICLAGPFLAAWTSGIERRTLLAGSLALYALMHWLSALAPDYGSLLATRIVTAVGAGLFTSQAAATAGLMVPAEQRGKAIGLVFMGWSISAVVGVPTGAYLGAAIGWRPTLALVGLLSALFAAWVWIQIPAGLHGATLDRAAWKSLARNRALLIAILVTGVQAAGQFTIYSYLALVFREFIGAGPTAISLLFACFGITGVIGNLIGSRVTDRLGAAQVAMVSLACMASALLLWPLTRDWPVMAVAMTMLWGLGCFSFNSAQQARLVGLAPRLASASVALNSSALNGGQAFGALTGGAIIAAAGIGGLSPVAFGLMVAAMILSQLALGIAARQVTAPTA